MPEKSVPVSSLTISVVSIISIAMGFISAYIAVLLKNINLKFTNNTEKLLKLEVTQKEYKDETKVDLNEAFNRIRDLENVQNILKTEHDVYCGKKEK